MKKLIIFAALALSFTVFADEIDDMFDMPEETGETTLRDISLSDAKRSELVLFTLNGSYKPGSAYSKSTLKRSAEINRRKAIFIRANIDIRPELVRDKCAKDYKFERTEIEIRAALERHTYNAFNAKTAAERDSELEFVKANFELLKLALMKREALWPKVK